MADWSSISRSMAGSRSRMRVDMRKVVLVPGDGIGPEIVASGLRVIEASGAKIEWERIIL